jgi:hypothetical protein
VQVVFLVVDAVLHVNTVPEPQGEALGNTRSSGNGCAGYLPDKLSTWSYCTLHPITSQHHMLWISCISPCHAVHHNSFPNQGAGLALDRLLSPGFPLDGGHCQVHWPITNQKLEGYRAAHQKQVVMFTYQKLESYLSKMGFLSVLLVPIWCIARSLALQFLLGRLQQLPEAIRESERYGLCRKDLLQIMAEQRGFQAFWALCLTSYSYWYCVENAYHAITLLGSLVLSTHSVAEHLHQRVDFEMDLEHTPPPGTPKVPSQ